MPRFSRLAAKLDMKTETPPAGGGNGPKRTSLPRKVRPQSGGRQSNHDRLTGGDRLERRQRLALGQIRGLDPRPQRRTGPARGDHAVEQLYMTLVLAGGLRRLL